MHYDFASLESCKFIVALALLLRDKLKIVAERPDGGMHNYYRLASRNSSIEWISEEDFFCAPITYSRP